MLPLYRGSVGCVFCGLHGRVRKLPCLPTGRPSIEGAWGVLFGRDPRYHSGRAIRYNLFAADALPCVLGPPEFIEGCALADAQGKG